MCAHEYRCPQRAEASNIPGAQVTGGCVLMSVPGPELRPHRAIADKLLPGSHLSNPQSCSIFIVYPGTTKWGQERLSCS